VGDFINDLNQAQQAAVKQIEGPGLIIAGAGSGKTRVLTYRIAWLLEQGVHASAILALTFTNKAAAEMKERIARLVGHEAAKHLWMGTFHSVFAKILRIEAPHTGYTSNFTIYDTADSRNVIKSIIKELMLDEQAYKPNEVFGRISAAKNNLVGAAAYASNPAITEEDSRNRRPRIADIFRIYSKRCHAADAMDFDDLLLNTNILFRDHPDVLLKYQEKFRYILVDEYQDTNYAQYLIVSRLAAKYRNISVVGDDAQSIYAFRGARIENILNFKRDYPEHKIFKLEQNYRSTKTLVDAANSLIAHNKGQIPKKVWSAKEAGNRLTVLECDSDLEEGKVVARSLVEKKDDTGCNNSNFAILYRTNAQSRIFEEALRRLGVPYKVYGSLSFYQRKEIKDLLAYFRLTVNNRDQEALFRIINYPARAIGKTTTDKIAAFSVESGLHPWEIISNISKHQSTLGINRGTASRIAGFTSLVESFSVRAYQEDAWQLAIHIATASGILKDLFDPKSTENITKYENIQELLNAVREFTINHDDPGENPTLASFLQNVLLLTDADTEKPDDRDKVTLMTIHSAKGLEFQHVFVCGLEEELFPNRFAAASLSELEEERRLFYVALTRAGTSATLSHARTRFRWGVPAVCRPSRFLLEIDPRFLEYPDQTIPTGRQRRPAPQTGYGSQGMPGNEYGRPLTSGPRTVPGMVHSGRLVRMDRTGDKSDMVPDDLSDLQAGMLVEHARFGRGEVIHIEGDPPNIKAMVNFTAAGQKQLLLKFAKLKILPG
jgi:DNA helicase II / ATP-dependent DNA helicase PcrA